MGHRLQEGSSQRRVTEHAQVCQGEGTQQPAPDGTLMICRIAFARAAAIARLKVRVAWCEAPQAVRSDQMLSAGTYDGTLLFERQRAFGQRNGENLIGPQRGVRPSRSIDDIKAIIRRLIPEALETGTHARCQGFIQSCRLAQY